LRIFSLEKCTISVRKNAQFPVPLENLQNIALCVEMNNIFFL